MKNLQILQNKAAKIILDQPFQASATQALKTLRWIKLKQRRTFHCCMFVHKCVNGNIDYDFNFRRNSHYHSYIILVSAMISISYSWERPGVNKHWHMLQLTTGIRWTRNCEALRVSYPSKPNWSVILKKYVNVLSTNVSKNQTKSENSRHRPKKSLWLILCILVGLDSYKTKWG